VRAYVRKNIRETTIGTSSSRPVAFITAPPLSFSRPFEYSGDHKSKEGENTLVCDSPGRFSERAAMRFGPRFIARCFLLFLLIHFVAPSRDMLRSTNSTSIGDSISIPESETVTASTVPPPVGFNLSYAPEMVESKISSLAQRGGPLSLTLMVLIADSLPCLPSQPVAILSGAVFGFWGGFFPFELGQLLAISFCMWAGRYLFRRRVNESETRRSRGNSKLSRILIELTAGLSSNEFWKVFMTVLVARQSPVLPFSLGNYFVGASTEAPLIPAILGTFIGVLPGNIMLVAAGAGGVALFKAHGFIGESLEIVGTICTVILVFACYKAINKVLCKEDDEKEEEADLELEPLVAVDSSY
jgi:uncharacterized membrane protein YdjX (TVP38/TMEM64 family)